VHNTGAYSSPYFADKQDVGKHHSSNHPHQSQDYYSALDDYTSQEENYNDHKRYPRGSRDKSDIGSSPRTSLQARLSPTRVDDQINSKKLLSHLGAYKVADENKNHLRALSGHNDIKENVGRGSGKQYSDVVSPEANRKRNENPLSQTRKADLSHTHVSRPGTNELKLRYEKSFESLNAATRLDTADHIDPSKFFSPKYEKGMMDEHLTRKLRTAQGKDKQKSFAETNGVPIKQIRDKGRRDVSPTDDDYKIIRSHKLKRETRDSSKNMDPKRSQKNLEGPYKSEALQSKEYKKHSNDIETVQLHLGNESDHYRMERDRDDAIKKMKRTQKEINNKYEHTREDLEKTSHEKDILRRENKELKQDMITKDQIVSKLERKVNSLNEQLASLTNKYNLQAESYTFRLRGLEKEKEDALYEKEKLRGSVEEYVSQHELSVIEDKAIYVKTIEERERQVKFLKADNEELLREVEQIKKALGEQNRHRAEHNGIYKDSYKPLTSQERFFVQKAVDEKHGDMSTELKHLKTEVEKLRSENESLKLEVQGRQTVRNFDNLERSIDRKDVRLESGKLKKATKEPNVGILSKVLKDLLNETGVGDINDIVKKVKDMKEGLSVNNKFVNGVLDLIYKCSPAGYFDVRPSCKQAWKWLKRLMEEYMTMKRQKDGTFSNDNLIVSSLMDYLALLDKHDIIPRVKHIVEENAHIKKLVERVTGNGLESSFGIANERTVENLRSSFNSRENFHSTAKFEDQSKFQSQKIFDR